MERITCLKCDASTDDPSPKPSFSCGAEPLLVQSAGPAGDCAGIPVGVLAGAGIVVVIVATVIMFPHLFGALSGSLFAGQGDTGQAHQVAESQDGILSPNTTLPVITTIPETTIAAAASTVPATIIPPPAISRTTETIAACQTFVVTNTVTAIPTETPAPKVTSQITLAETWIPEQPPAESYISTTPGAPFIDHTALEARIHDLINAQREQNGNSELSYDSFLADIARGHSYDMALRNYFDHTDPDGKNAKARGDDSGYPCIRGYRNYYTDGIAENIYQGYRYNSYLPAPNGTIMAYKWSSLEDIANQAVTGWMNSEGHRKNILDDHFQQEGIGVAFSADNKIYVTENFC
jgi:uncharacterized protein YkwD